jgi:hypothetical protein
VNQTSVDNLVVFVRRWFIGCAAALVLVLGGCGGGHHPTTATTAKPGAGQGPTASFRGGSVPGTVYLGLGPDLVSLDAYRLSGPLSKAKRLTYSPVGLGIQGLVANQRDVLIQRICCDNLNFIELLNLARRGGLPGTVVGTGNVLAIAPDGRFAYVVPDYRGCGCDALLVRPSLLGPDRLVYREAHPGTILAGAWSPSNRLAILVGNNGLTVTNAEIVFDPGTSAQRTIQPGGTINVESGLWWGPRGELSYDLSGSTPRVVIRLPSGETRSFLLNASEVPTCWLPNDTIFTYYGSKGALGTMDPRSGAVTTIGHFSNSMWIFVFDCAH